MKLFRDALIAVVCCLALVASSVIGNCCVGKTACCATVVGESATASVTGSGSVCCAKSSAKDGAGKNGGIGNGGRTICRCAPLLPVGLDVAGAPIIATAPQALVDELPEARRGAPVGTASSQLRGFHCLTPPGRGPPPALS